MNVSRANIAARSRRRWIRVPGVLRLSYKLLVNDKAKFSALLVGITFAAFLMIQMTSMFAGVLKRASANVTNIGASMWIMDKAVNNATSAIPVPDYLLNSVRSLDGVRYAVPLYSGGALVKLKSGIYQPVNIIGLDDTSLFGRPQLLAGKIQDLYSDNAFVVVRDAEFRKLENPAVGTEFEINDHRAVVVGVADVAASGLFGVPTLYTTYSRALQYIPTTRFTISYILAEPKDEASIAKIESEVDRLGYLALTKDEFDQRIANFYKYQTGVGINILLMTAISFIVGLSISGQTFYTFILENLDKFGALKAIGAKGRELVGIILFQAAFTALTGFGLGVGMCALVIGVAKMKLPSYASVITYPNIVLTLAMVIVIAGVSSYFGIRRVLRVEPFDIFRG